MQPAELLALTKTHKIPHALLFCGGVLSEKREFALNLAKILLGQKFMADHSHPDLYYLEENINIDQIREISYTLSHTAHQAGYKIIILGLAESMPMGAMNALLKTLEEPPEHSMIILITEFLNLLPMTIRSRCQKVFFTGVSKVEDYSHLKKILYSHQNPNEKAIIFEKKTSAEIIEILSQFYFIVYEEIIKNNNSPVLFKLFKWLDEMSKAREKLLKKYNPNNLLLFENLFYQWNKIWNL